MIKMLMNGLRTILIMYCLHAIVRLFTQMNAHFLVMNSERCNRYFGQEVGACLTARLSLSKSLSFPFILG